MQARQQQTTQVKEMEKTKRVVLKLVGPNIQQDVVLEPNRKYSIGRDPENDIHLDDDRVSRHHAVLLMEGGEWVLHDQKSVNQILTSDGLVAELKVHSGTSFQIGPVLFTAHKEGEILGELGGLTSKLQGKNRQVMLLASTLVAIILLGILMSGNEEEKPENIEDAIVNIQSEEIVDEQIFTLPVDGAAAKKSKEHYYLAIQHYDTRNLENAIQELQLAIKSNPNNQSAKRKFAEIERELDLEITRHYQQGCFHARFLRRYEAQQEFRTVIQMVRNKTDGRYLEARRMLELLEDKEISSLSCGES